MLITKTVRQYKLHRGNSGSNTNRSQHLEYYTRTIIKVVGIPIVYWDKLISTMPF